MKELEVAQRVLTTVSEHLPRLIELFQSAGGRDAFLVGIDTMLASARAKADADLVRKHGKP